MSMMGTPDLLSPLKGRSQERQMPSQHEHKHSEKALYYVTDTRAALVLINHPPNVGHPTAKKTP